MRILRGTTEFLFKSACFVLLFLLLFNADTAIYALKKSTVYAVTTVSVAIFPYMIMASLLSTGRSAKFLGAPFIPISRYILKIRSVKAATVLSIALIGGFAAAGVVISRLFAKQVLSLNEAKRLVIATYIPSAPFIIIVVGKNIFGSYTIGIYIAIAIVLATLLCASLLMAGKKIESHHTTDNDIATPIGAHINEAIKAATINTLYICGLICFFGMVCEMMYIFFIGSDIAIIFAGLMEFSTALSYTVENGIYWTTFFLGLLGICSYFQLSVITGEITEIKTFVLSRLISAPLSLLILKLLFALRPIEITAISSMGKIYILPYQYNIEMSILVFLIIIISFTDFIAKKGLQ